ncbi:hypothetical protein JZ751_026090, partial [Albula glossodonta]
MPRKAEALPRRPSFESGQGPLLHSPAAETAVLLHHPAVTANEHPTPLRSTAMMGVTLSSNIRAATSTDSPLLQCGTS